MQDLRLTLVQTIQHWENKRANLNHFEKILERISDTDLILLPEMFHTGFSMNATELAEGTKNSEAIDFLKKVARQKNAAIFTSFIAQEKGDFFNRGVFVFPDGVLKIYDKRKLFTLAKEEETYTPGSQAIIVEFRAWKINLQICYDLRFPEISRNHLDANGNPAYDLCLYVANWPEKRSSHWKALLPARAIENQCFVAGLNRVGEDGKGLTYSGDSNVYSPFGEKLLADTPGTESIQTAVLAFAQLEQIRSQLNFLKDAGVF